MKIIYILDKFYKTTFITHKYLCVVIMFENIFLIYKNYHDVMKINKCDILLLLYIISVKL